MVGPIVAFGGSILPVLFSSVCAAILWWQMAFVAHDLGHNGVTHNQKLDTIFGIVLANFTGGLSLGWWKHNHNGGLLLQEVPTARDDLIWRHCIQYQMQSITW